MNFPFSYILIKIINDNFFPFLHRLFFFKTWILSYTFFFHHQHHHSHLLPHLLHFLHISPLRVYIIFVHVSISFHAFPFPRSHMAFTHPPCKSLSDFIWSQTIFLSPPPFFFLIHFFTEFHVSSPKDIVPIWSSVNHFQSHSLWQ